MIFFSVKSIVHFGYMYKLKSDGKFSGKLPQYWWRILFFFGGGGGGGVNNYIKLYSTFPPCLRFNIFYLFKKQIIISKIVQNQNILNDDVMLYCHPYWYIKMSDTILTSRFLLDSPICSVSYTVSFFKYILLYVIS